MKTNDNIVLVYPKKGEPPQEFGNYKRDPKDPYILILEWVPCRHRTVAIDEGCIPCPNKKFCAFCKVKLHKVDQHHCQGCDIPDKLHPLEPQVEEPLMDLHEETQEQIA